MGLKSLNKPNQIPIPSEERFLALAQAVIAVERQHHQQGQDEGNQAAREPRKVRIASLAELQGQERSQPDHDSESARIFTLL